MQLIKDDSFDAEEERRIAEEDRIRQAEIAKQETARIEKERLVALEKRKQDEKNQRKVSKEQELQIAKNRYQQAYNSCYQQRVLMDGTFINGIVKINKMDNAIKHLPQYPEYQRCYNIMMDEWSKIDNLERQLKSGNY